MLNILNSNQPALQFSATLQSTDTQDSTHLGPSKASAWYSSSKAGWCSSWDFCSRVTHSLTCPTLIHARASPPNFQIQRPASGTLLRWPTGTEPTRSKHHKLPNGFLLRLRKPSTSTPAGQSWFTLPLSPQVQWFPPLKGLSKAAPIPLTLLSPVSLNSRCIPLRSPFTWCSLGTPPTSDSPSTKKGLDNVSSVAYFYEEWHCFRFLHIFYVILKSSAF